MSKNINEVKKYLIQNIPKSTFEDAEFQDSQVIFIGSDDQPFLQNFVEDNQQYEQIKNIDEKQQQQIIFKSFGNQLNNNIKLLEAKSNQIDNTIQQKLSKFESKNVSPENTPKKYQDFKTLKNFTTNNSNQKDQQNYFQSKILYPNDRTIIEQSQIQPQYPHQQIIVSKQIRNSSGLKENPSKTKNNSSKSSIGIDVPSVTKISIPSLRSPNLTQESQSIQHKDESQSNLHENDEKSMNIVPFHKTTSTKSNPKERGKAYGISLNNNVNQQYLVQRFQPLNQKNKQTKLHSFVQSDEQQIKLNKIKSLSIIEKSQKLYLVYELRNLAQKKEIQLSYQYIKYLEQYFIIEFKIYLPIMRKFLDFPFHKYTVYIQKLFNLLQQNHEKQLIQFLSVTNGEQKSYESGNNDNKIEKILYYCKEKIFESLKEDKSKKIKTIYNFIKIRLNSIKKIENCRNTLFNVTKIKIKPNFLEFGHLESRLMDHYHILNNLQWLLGFQELESFILHKIQDLESKEIKQKKKRAQLPSLKNKYRNLKIKKEKQYEFVMKEVKQQIIGLYKSIEQQNV